MQEKQEKNKEGEKRQIDKSRDAWRGNPIKLYFLQNLHQSTNPYH